MNRYEIDEKYKEKYGENVPTFHCVTDVDRDKMFKLATSAIKGDRGAITHHDFGITDTDIDTREY